MAIIHKYILTWIILTFVLLVRDHQRVDEWNSNAKCEPMMLTSWVEYSDLNDQKGVFLEWRSDNFTLIMKRFPAVLAEVQAKYPLQVQKVICYKRNDTNDNHVGLKEYALLLEVALSALLYNSMVGIALAMANVIH